jgi:hypothetical protein
VGEGGKKRFPRGIALNNPWVGLGIPLLGLFLGLLALSGSLKASRRRRIVENIPTIKTSGVYIGLVELKGNAECASPLTSFLAQVPCVYFQWSVEEHWSRTVVETTTDAQGKTTTRIRHESGWTTVAADKGQTPFYLRDEEGTVLIHPEGAEIEPESVFSEDCTPSDPLYYGKGPNSAISNSDHRRHFSETALKVGCPLYIVGQARERQDFVAPEIAADPDAPMFLISTRTEEKVTSGFTIRTWVFGVLGLVLTAGGIAIREYAVHEPLGAGFGQCLVAGGGYCLVYFLGWCWMVYNSLANLRQRVRQAWSLVEVQTKRRADLIPNLVSMVKGIRDYEKTLQEHLSLLRSQVEATPPGVQGPDYQACVSSVIAISEAYPELRSQEAFLKIQKELVATEERIALARGYFNEIATHYNTRLQMMPEGLLAGMTGFQPVELMKAAGFERATVAVN